MGSSFKSIALRRNGCEIVAMSANPRDRSRPGSSKALLDDERRDFPFQSNPTGSIRRRGHDEKDDVMLLSSHSVGGARRPSNRRDWRDRSFSVDLMRLSAACTALAL